MNTNTTAVPARPFRVYSAINFHDPAHARPLPPHVYPALIVPEHPTYGNENPPRPGIPRLVKTGKRRLPESGGVWPAMAPGTYYSAVVPWIAHWFEHRIPSHLWHEIPIVFDWEYYKRFDDHPEIWQFYKALDWMEQVARDEHDAACIAFHKSAANAGKRFSSLTGFYGEVGTELATDTWIPVTTEHDARKFYATFRRTVAEAVTKRAEREGSGGVTILPIVRPYEYFLPAGPLIRAARSAGADGLIFWEEVLPGDADLADKLDFFGGWWGELASSAAEISRVGTEAVNA